MDRTVATLLDDINERSSFVPSVSCTTLAQDDDLQRTDNDCSRTAIRTSIGADDGIRTRDPHLGKETHLLRQDRCTPLSSLSPVSSSAQSAESARLQRFTFNALNLCEIDDPVEAYHDALGHIVEGDPGPLQELYSHRDDVTLSNPWGPTRRGWADVSAGVERAASQLREGRHSPGRTTLSPCSAGRTSLVLSRTNGGRRR